MINIEVAGRLFGEKRVMIDGITHTIEVDVEQIRQKVYSLLQFHNWNWSSFGVLGDDTLNFSKLLRPYFVSWFCGTAFATDKVPQLTVPRVPVKPQSGFVFA